MWPSEFACSNLNTVLQESLGALKAFNLSSGLKFNACHGEKPKFFQITAHRSLGCAPGCDAGGREFETSTGPTLRVFK